MSRTSRKSELSPSATRGSNAIDLGKNSGIDLGKKSQPSITSGGIGITTEVTNIGGLSVTGGVSVDISPIDLAVNYDPAENSVSVATGAELPGGLLGVSGGVTVDLNTGEVVGGAIGGEALGLGVNISNSKDGGFGVELTVQIPFTPIELSVGLGASPPKKPTPPTTTPTNWEKPILPAGDPRKNCKIILAIQSYKKEISNDGKFLFYEKEVSSSGSYNPETGKLNAIEQIIKNHPSNNLVTNTYLNTQGIWGEYGNVSFFNRIINTSGNGIYQPHDILVGIEGFESDIYSGLNESIYINEEIKGAFITTIRRRTYTVVYSSCSIPDQNTSPDLANPFSPTPFPNPPPTKRNMDNCCRESTKLLRAIHKGLGISKFPGQLPSTIIQEVPKEGEQPAEPFQVPIEDLVDLLNWQFERDDERWGQWKIQIDIKDSDITKEGDQKKQIKFPNLAESIAEFEGQLLSLMTNVDALVAMQVKTLAESGMARQEAIKGYLASKAIIKYMAFKSSEIDVPVPMTFTAGAETISELLKESEGHIKGTDYVEKETLRDVYLDLLQAAAITRAVHWQRINTKTDTKSQLLSILKGSVDLAASIAKPQSPNGEGSEKTFDPEKNFEDFIDSVEDGFRNTTGITDIQNPYGKSPKQRPRIRQIGDNISQAGGSD